MTIIKTLTRAARHLNNVLNHDRQCLPYWMMAVTGEGLAEFEDRRYCSGHSLGRWWNAILRLADSFGCQSSADIKTIMLQHAWDMSDNPAGIFLEDIQPDDPATWYIHSCRETMLAFAMIARCWDDDRAADCGRRAITRMRDASRDLGAAWTFDLGAGSTLTKGGDSVYTHGLPSKG